MLFTWPLVICLNLNCIWPFGSKEEIKVKTLALESHPRVLWNSLEQGEDIIMFKGINLFFPFVNIFN